MRVLVYALVAVLVCTGAAAPSATSPALVLYKSGDYQGAIKAGIAADNEDGFAVAARAALAEETLREHPCLECLKRAEDYARRAIAAGGKLPESYVYLAAALGHQSRIIGTVRAKIAGYPEEAKGALDTAYRIRPGFSWTLAALGGWNIEVVRIAGRIIGDSLYDASFDEGVTFFRRATAAEPGNPAIHFQFALALVAYDLDANRALIGSELSAAANGTPSSAYDSAIKERAARLKQLLDARNDDGVQLLVRKYQGYP